MPQRDDERKQGWNSEDERAQRRESSSGDAGQGRGGQNRQTKDRRSYSYADNRYGREGSYYSELGGQHDLGEGYEGPTRRGYQAPGGQSYRGEGGSAPGVYRGSEAERRQQQRARFRGGYRDERGAEERGTGGRSSWEMQEDEKRWYGEGGRHEAEEVERRQGYPGYALDFEGGIGEEEDRLTRRDQAHLRGDRLFSMQDRYGDQSGFRIDDDERFSSWGAVRHPRPAQEGWEQVGPMTGRGPRGYRRSDERIQDDVCDRLTRHGEIDASEVEIQVEQGEVTLNGMVPTRRMKRLAEDEAWSLPGVEQVHNRLRVDDRPQSHRVRPDLSEEMRRDPQVRSQGPGIPEE